MKKLLPIALLVVAPHVLFGESNYLDLVKKSLLNLIYQDPSCSGERFNFENRVRGKDWPSQAHTMIGLEGLNNIQFCLEDIIANNVPGDCIETGVWRGGATILMRAILKEHNITDRTVWVADSFEGLPTPNPQKYPADNYTFKINNDVLGVSLEVVQENFRRYGLLDNQVKFLKGYFKDSLPTAPIKQIALLRLDGDFYESTMDALVHLYDKVPVGGYIIIDDYEAMESCAKAVHDFRNKHGITEPMYRAGWSIVYWKKAR